MGESSHAIDRIGKASEARRKARSELREAAISVADGIAKKLRRGDSVRVDGSATYSIEDVTWRVWIPGPPDEEQHFLAPTTVNALVRQVGDRKVALSDPRKNYDDDDGLRWVPMGHRVYVSDALDAGERSLLRLHRPSDEELVEFIEEVEAVGQAFQEMLDAEAERYRSAVAALAGEE